MFAKIVPRHESVASLVWKSAWIFYACICIGVAVLRARWWRCHRWCRRPCCANSATRRASTKSRAGSRDAEQRWLSGVGLPLCSQRCRSLHGPANTRAITHMGATSIWFATVTSSIRANMAQVAKSPAASRWPNYFKT